MSHKSFSTKPREPVTFDIDGERFTCHDQIPVTSLLDYASRLMPDASSQEVRFTASDVLDFFKLVMPEDEHERFMKFIDDPVRNVDLDTLGELLIFLVEAYGGRPTQPSSG